MIELFTAPWCGKCKALKNWMTQEGIDFEERNIDLEPSAEKELQDNNLLNIPILKIDGEYHCEDIYKLKEHLVEFIQN